MDQPLGQHAVWKPDESCTVPGCDVDLSTLSGYHRRHRVCHIHLKTPEVQLHGQLARFCQQCGRFQPLEDFQDTRRSCKAALRAHNERRRQNTIASDNALAHTRFSTATSTSRRSAASTATEQHLSGAGTGPGGGPRRQLAKAVSMRSSGYSAEGVGVLRRTISHPDTCRSLRPSSHGYDGCTGSYSLSDGAACLQPQQQQQQYSLADSPTASSGSTVAVQNCGSKHSTRLRAQERRQSQHPHMQALALQQRQQLLVQMAPDWHSGCNPAVAQLDAAQLLQAAAAAGQGAACMPAQAQQLQHSTLTQQQLQQIPLSAGALPAWQQHMTPVFLQQQQQQLPPCTQGLAAAPGLLAGWQQQRFVPGCQGLDTAPLAWPQQQLLHAPSTFSGSTMQCAGMDAGLPGWQAHAQGSWLEAPQHVLQPQLQQQSVIAAASAGWPAADLQPIAPESLGEGCHVPDNWGKGSYMQGITTTSASAQQLDMQHPAVSLPMPAVQHVSGTLDLTQPQCAPLPQQQTSLQHTIETHAVQVPAGGGLLPLPHNSPAVCVTLQPPTTGQVQMPPGQTHERGSYQALLHGSEHVVYASAHLQQQLQDSSAQAVTQTGWGGIAKQQPQPSAQVAAAPEQLPVSASSPDTASAVQLSCSSVAAPPAVAPAAGAASAVAPAAAAGASNSCLSPELGFWECMAAAETAEDFSSEEIDALLEHAFGDFLASEPGMCETAAGTGCCGSSAPASPAAGCAAPAAGAACTSAAGKQAL